MGQINWGRVLLGGLLAGLVLNIVEYGADTYVWADRNAAFLKAHSLQLRPHAVAVFLVLGFLWGIASIWAYSVARPRHGAGPTTAIIVAVGVWFLSSFLPGLGDWASGVGTTRMFGEGTLLDLAALIVATLAGAALYREAGGSGARTSEQTVAAGSRG